MPIEIRELVVKATVDSKPPPEGARREAKPKGKEKEKIVALAAEQAVEIIRRRKER